MDEEGIKTDDFLEYAKDLDFKRKSKLSKGRRARRTHQRNWISLKNIKNNFNYFFKLINFKKLFIFKIL